MKKLIVPQNNLILFISFGGKKFDDSPKAIYDQMIRDNRFDSYELVWAFQNPEDFEIPRGSKVKTDSLKYYVIALKSRCWITNSRVERGLSFKGKNTFYFNTWHGTPIKKMGTDISHNNKSFGTKAKWDIDIMTSQSKYEADIFARVFDIEREKFVISGLPRNDVLIDATPKIKKDILQKMGLPLDKKVILYAPTFREYERDKQLNCIMAPPIDFSKWEKEIGEEYILLLRAHYEVAEVLNVNQSQGFVYNVSDYPILNELMIASDVLISDYSSIFFDYSIQNKPMICFAYDYDTYTDKRGLYFNVMKALPSGSNENDILDIIQTKSSNDILTQVKSFRKSYVQSFGNATNSAIDIIYENIKK
ncbi:CDP-glycerol glycerophosphotransferase family protein [Halobacillus kuroshimensis]|uniref:CDP-glycerol glycerophosphotransferase family protein n=1 Tax=Halobacillus kuroshimensis TaxID=302481 RepID=A0ABS3DUY3_9BACI|nr:CDP-glycerol glycerophosphotransferase family protein [Halobacillus kuroshimensis]MBN8235137.1 CDP-glycerol glycerophosphotransferase family protein [Halobacillus kuroshimensis]